GYDAIQNHSTIDHNYLETGFWAKSLGEELPNQGLTATFIVRIDDVTREALKGVTASMDEATRQSVIDKNINDIRRSARAETWQGTLVRPFYYGNQYYLFVTETFRDVRLVGAPPSSIGKFGADTDNWVWPRHTGDFSMFRIYAGKDNRPADYSVDNVPYKPKRSLSISLDGVAQNDFTMVFGFPGRTQEYLPASGVRLNAEVLNPVKIGIRDETLKIWDSHMRSDAQTKIQYSSKYASMANAWKKWIGESGGIASTGAIAKKLAYEAEYRKRLGQNPALKSKYDGVLEQLDQKYQALQPLALVRDRYLETANAIELFAITNQLRRVLRTYSSQGETGFQRSKDSVLHSLEEFFRDYRADIDRKVMAALLDDYFTNVPAGFTGSYAAELWNQSRDAEKIAAGIYTGSGLVSLDGVRRILSLPAAEAVKAIGDDPAFRFTTALAEAYQKNTAPPVNALQNEINQLQRTYMQAQMDVFREKKFYPDANSTLRVTYGQVKGYRPRDAVSYGYYTYLDGVMEKYKPGDYEFDVPQRLIELYRSKDYGPYGKNGKMPVCFIGSNHTTGGNSGSPALDAYGNLIGLNFDRVWEGTMSDLNYDPSICRNIMVDIRYVLFIVDKYAGATNLIQEMKLVHPKAKKS
ncbi:MAG TPA: S46 family peptidase, partial [Flavisolibacter sp.]